MVISTLIGVISNYFISLVTLITTLVTETHDPPSTLNSNKPSAKTQKLVPGILDTTRFSQPE